MKRKSRLPLFEELVNDQPNGIVGKVVDFLVTKKEDSGEYVFLDEETFDDYPEASKPLKMGYIEEPDGDVTGFIMYEVGNNTILVLGQYEENYGIVQHFPSKEVVHRVSSPKEVPGYPGAKIVYDDKF